MLLMANYLRFEGWVAEIVQELFKRTKLQITAAKIKRDGGRIQS